MSENSKNPYPFKLFTSPKYPNLAKAVAEHLQTELLFPKEKEFKNGEILSHQNGSVRDSDVFIIYQVTANSTAMYEELFKLVSLIRALKQGSASRITVVMPYLPFSRQDEPSNHREPVNVRLIPDMLKAAGADRLVILRLHSPKSATAWPLIEMENVGTRKFLVQYLKHESGIDFSDCAIAAPDVGAAKDARNFAENLGNLPLSMIDKRRDTVHGATAIMNVIGEHHVKGKHVIIVDDMIDTGSTLVPVTQALRDHGATKVSAIVTHGIFSGNAVENLNNAGFDSLFVTNSCPIEEYAEKIPSLKIIDVSKLIARVIDNMHNGNSVTELWHGEGAEQA